jgi:Domain of unknown function (DUF1844)
MAEEREFEVIDKRGARAESKTAAEAASAQSEAGATAPGAAGGGGITEEELLAAMEEAGMAAGGEMPELSVPGALHFCIETLQGLAWIKMGLVAAPGSGKIEKELPQAKVAIDAIGDLVARLEPFAAESERRELQTMLSNLRINFVQKSQQP